MRNNQPVTQRNYQFDALNDMRDAMVKASLLLQDLRFESDAVHRSATVELLDELLNKIKLG